MAPRFAYWVKDRAPQDVALDPPPRLRTAWPNMPDDSGRRFMCVKHPSGHGTLVVFPANDGAAVQLDTFGPGRDTHDGMVYYPSLQEPSCEWLIRPEEARPRGEWVKIVEGEMHVAVAFAAPRRLVLCAGGGYKAGKSTTEFGRLAHEVFPLWTSKEGLAPTDSRLWRLLFLVYRESYWLTEEQTEDLGWLTDADIIPVLDTAFGCNPKPSAAELAGSHSSAPTIPASP